MAEDMLLFVFSRDEMKFAKEETTLRDTANKIMAEIGYDDLLGDGGKGGPTPGLVEGGMTAGPEVGMSDLSEGADFFLM